MILSNSIACREQTTRCTVMRFSLFDSTINWLCLKFVYWYGYHDSSCSYCIWNRYSQNHRSILPNFLLFAWFDTLEFNRQPCSNNKIYYDADFADRFRYQLAMFGIRVLKWLSWLHHAHIAYITDGAKIIATFCRISYCLHDFIRLNSIVGDVRTKRCTMIWFSMIDSDINWLFLKCVYSRGYLDSWYWYCIWNSYIKNHPW